MPLHVKPRLLSQSISAYTCLITLNPLGGTEWWIILHLQFLVSGRQKIECFGGRSDQWRKIPFVKWLMPGSKCPCPGICCQLLDREAVALFVDLLVYASEMLQLYQVKCQSSINSLFDSNNLDRLILPGKSSVASGRASVKTLELPFLLCCTFHLKYGLGLVSGVLPIRCITRWSGSHHGC